MKRKRKKEKEKRKKERKKERNIYNITFDQDQYSIHI